MEDVARIGKTLLGAACGSQRRAPRAAELSAPFLSMAARTNGSAMSEQQTSRFLAWVFGGLVLSLLILNAAAMP